MDFNDILGQVFRDAIGMPTKVSSYNVKLELYDEISNSISEVESSSTTYLEETHDINWILNGVSRLKLESDLANGLITLTDYATFLNQLDIERKSILDDFVSTTDLYFVIAYRNRLNSIKERHLRDGYITLMRFDTWFDMEEARELANLASLQIRTSDKYIDAKRIAEIRDKYMLERKMRRGR